MNQTLNFWVMGGDGRQAALARLLAGDGHTVHTYALAPEDVSLPNLLPEHSLRGAEQANCVIFPMPPATDSGLLNAPRSPHDHSLSSILDCLSPSVFLCAGRIDSNFSGEAQARNLVPHDYFTREELIVANAVPTAEGALQLAMEHLPITIHGARVLVIGFGRVGRVTAQKFHALDGQVTVSARKHDQLSWAQAMGLHSIPLTELFSRLSEYDLILNTVPSLVLPLPHLEQIQPSCLILDLSSNPGGDGVPFEHLLL